MHNVFWTGVTPASPLKLIDYIIDSFHEATRAR